MQTRILSMLLFLVPLSGCIVWDNGTKEPGPAEGYIFPTCGPTDGPALDVFIPEPAVEGCRAVESKRYLSPYTFTHTRIFLFGFPDTYPESASTFYFGRDLNAGEGNGSDGWGGHCEAGETECSEAKMGTIMLPPTGTESFETEITIVYSDGTNYTRQLRLQMCPLEEPLFCG